jgi:hypothetical protein
LKYERPSLRGLLENLDSSDICRHQIRRELDPPELQVEDLRDRFDQQRLGESGGPGDETVPAREEREEDLRDNLILADDDLCEFPG